MAETKSPHRVDAKKFTHTNEAPKNRVVASAPAAPAKPGSPATAPVNPPKP